MIRVFTLLSALVFVLAACGPPGPKVYNEARTRACLVSKQLRVGPAPASDFVAQTALGGAFSVRFAHNHATVSFGSTVKDGQGLDAEYQSVHAKNVGIADVLRTQGSAVMLWHSHPSDADLALLQNCLKT